MFTPEFSPPSLMDATVVVPLRLSEARLLRAILLRYQQLVMMDDSSLWDETALCINLSTQIELALPQASAFPLVVSI
jgi:hypothetical protein